MILEDEKLNQSGDSMTDVAEFKLALVSGDATLVRSLLASNGGLADIEIPWKADASDAETCQSVPLHFLCDAVFNGVLDKQTAIELSHVLLENGADTELTSSTGRDTPLIAAASLYCPEIGIALVDHGANVVFEGTFGGTPMHWAAWTGQLNLVTRLLDEPHDIEKRCDQFYATPLFWSIHGFAQGNPENRGKQFEVAKLLVQRGADIRTGNRFDKSLRQMFDLDNRDNEFYTWLVDNGGPEVIEASSG